MLLLNVVYILLGLTGLYFGSEWLVTGSSRTALYFKISPLIIGMTIVAVGTSAPELVVSVLAATEGSPGLALGNVIGSNIANIGLILGLTGTLKVLAIHETLVKREIPIMIVVTLFASVLILDGRLNRIDGLLLLFGFVAFTGFFYYLAREEHDDAEQVILEEIDVEMDEQTRKVKVNLRMEAVRIFVGSIVLIIGARLMVTGATNFAEAIGVSDLVIGVTLVAFGTSLPELATSLTAAFKGENDIAIGNIIGSNIANLLLVLGAASTVATIDVGRTDLSVVEYLVMIAFSLLLLPFARNRELSRVESAIFLGCYVAFIVYSFFFSSGQLPVL
jgi:cation:H+ antiporter